MVHFTWQAQHFLLLAQDVGAPRRQTCGRGAASVLQKIIF